jgi:hypothetical protein
MRLTARRSDCLDHLSKLTREGGWEGGEGEENTTDKMSRVVGNNRRKKQEWSKSRSRGVGCRQKNKKDKKIGAWE